MKPLKTYALQGIAGGAMGTSSYKYKTGTAYVYNIDGFNVVKEVYKNSERFLIDGKNLEEIIITDKLDMNNVRYINEENRLKELDQIMLSDLSRVKKIMTENKEGFVYLMDHYKDLNKAESFAGVVKDYYNNNFNYPTDTYSIIKVMVKYGYTFTTVKDAEKLFR